MYQLLANTRFTSQGECLECSIKILVFGPLVVEQGVVIAKQEGGVPSLQTSRFLGYTHAGRTCRLHTERLNQ